MSQLALITGASSGIGLELAHCFARGGYSCILVARRRERLKQLALDLKNAYGCDAEVLVTDLADPAAPQQLYLQVKQRQYNIDVLVNNAGFGNAGRFDRLSLQDELDLMHVNMVALGQLCRLFLSDFVCRGRGRVLNVASVAGFLPGPLMASYYASKAYVVSLSRALQLEFQGSGVTVSVLCPGPTKTEFFERADMQTAELARGRLMLMDSAAVVAEAGYRGTMKGKPLIVPGLANKFIVLAARLLPSGWSARMVKRINRRHR